MHPSRLLQTLIVLVSVGILVPAMAQAPGGLMPLAGVKAITAGGYSTCALTTAGGVKCWGDNRFAQLGDNTLTQRLTPTDVVGFTSGVMAIAAGRIGACALTNAGGVKCWGGNDNLTPVDVVGLTSGVMAIAAGDLHTCALTTAGGVKCWGTNGAGELGDNTLTQRPTPADVVGLTSGVIAIAAGGEQTCALTTAGGVKCWGWNVYGQVGDNTLTNRLTPVDVFGLTSGITAISAGSNHTCALTTAGGVKCWGDNRFAQLGDNALTQRLTPIDVIGLTGGVTAISAGGLHTCALTAAGGVKCWGWNGRGELGDNTLTQRPMPVDVVGLTSGVMAIAAHSGDQTCALTNVGGVKCWGWNLYGQLGDNTQTDRLSPVDVLTTTNAPPPTAPPGPCTVTVSPPSLPAGGGTVLLAANCAGGSPTSFSWSGGFANGRTTSVNTISGSVTATTTFAVIASNAGGNSSAVSTTVAVTSAPPPLAAVVVNDGDFASWTPFSFVTPNYAERYLPPPNTSHGSATRVATGGHPDAYLKFNYVVSAGDTLWLGGVKTDYVYNPVVEGAIDTVSVNYNEYIGTGSPGGGAESSWRLVVEQAGRRYFSPSLVVRIGFFGWDPNPVPESSINFNAANFDTNPWAGLGTILPDGNRPDFSSTAAPLKFGFVIGSVISGTAFDETFSLGIDNFSLSVTKAISPPTLTPPGSCALTASPSSLPAGGGTVLLGANCAGGAPTSFTWSGGFANGQTTSVGTQSGNISGTTTFSVVARNAAGSSSASITVTVGLPSQPSPISLLNPLQTALPDLLKGAYTVDPLTVLNSGAANALSADGMSAVVVAVVSNLPNTPVTFSVTPYGSMTVFDKNYLSNPSHPNPGLASVTVSNPDHCNEGCVYLALLWSPQTLPTNAGTPSVNLTVTATQAAANLGPATIKLQPPPLLLVHGIWSSAKAAGFSQGTGGFFDWLLNKQYPHNLIGWVDYGQKLSPPELGILSQRSFVDKDIQTQFQLALNKLLTKAAAHRTAARQVDVVGHSMGGLVTRYFLKTSSFPSDPVHTLITIGTPHQGTELAARLNANSTVTVLHNSDGLIDDIICTRFGLIPCTLGGVFAAQGYPVSTGVAALVPGSDDLKGLPPSNLYSAIIGQAPTNSVTRNRLNVLIGGFLANQSVDSILGTVANDTIVPWTSQRGGATNTSIVPDIVHTALVPSDTGETESHAVWNQTFTWLTGLQPAAALMSKTGAKATTSDPLPIFDLTGYAEVAASNVSFSPPTNSVLTIGAPVHIVATSTTKTLTEILLFQSVVDPADAPLLFATQAPFSIEFTPDRLGTANFVAFALFSDMTYAVTALSYPLQPSGPLVSLSLGDDPDENLTVGMTVRVRVNAAFSNGPVDVTQAATYRARTGTTTVFSVDPGGAITATGNGVDWLDVSYLGLTASAQISVSTPAAVNHEGLWWNSPAGSESGWGINFAHQGDVIFASWFTYDLTGKGWWLVMTAPNIGGNTFSGSLLTVTGPAFDAVPFDPAQVVGTAVGTGTLTFSDANNGSFAYTVNGISQTKAITREVFGPLPSCTFSAQNNLTLATNYQDLWWKTPAASESGWGINLTHQGDAIFGTWFTYDHDHTPMWLVVTANKNGPGIYSGTLFRTTGPAFNAVPFNPAAVVGTNVGTATFTFTDGNAGNFAYTVNGMSQSKTITREVFRTPGTLCQ